MKNNRLFIFMLIFIFSCASQPFFVQKVYGPIRIKELKKMTKIYPKNTNDQIEYCKTLVQFTYAFIQQEAEFIQDKNLDKSRKMIDKARKNYKEAFQQGYKAIKIKYPNFSPCYEKLQETKKEDLLSLYWTAAALGLYISVTKNDFQAIGRINEVGALAYRSLALDSTWNNGSVYEMLCSYESSRIGYEENAQKKANLYFERALQASGGQRASVYIAKAEGVCIQNQNKEEFEKLLKNALSVPPQKKPGDELSNKIAKKRARWLLSRTEELFF